MKLLVATMLTQGAAPTDRCLAAEGEPVRLARCRHGRCGCMGFVGVDSGAVTTTARVVDLPVGASTIRGVPEAERLALAAMLRPLAPGAVVERSGDGIWPRRLPAA